MKEENRITVKNRSWKRERREYLKTWRKEERERGKLKGKTRKDKGR